MESSYLTVELFRKLHLEPKKEKPNPRNAPSQNADIYSDNHFRYFPAEEIPVQYGGNERDDDTKFSNEAVSEVVVKPGSSVNIEIPASEVIT
ncbi:hypothetical protein F2Q69_00031281 [Brassica cretica]|uniref:Uncharacterized protein n=1 Tax=Brassica cretica TaxID=69181 RepID=A0A8S9S8H0_BRACR|nr:hypothetical protein F2Q69_00031281 [Brassica cretica]